MSAREDQVPAPLHLGHWLAVACRSLPEALAAPEGPSVAIATARWLPAECLGCLEVRLGPDARGAPVDLSVELNTSEQVRQVQKLLRAPGLRSVLHTWALEKISRKALSGFWLEFDAAPPPAQGLPDPLVLAKIAEKLPPDWLLQSFMPAFHGEPLTERQAALLLESVRLLPEGFRPVYLFSLRARGSRAIRLDSVGSDLARVPAYLRTVISEEAARQVEALLPLVADADSPHFSFDIGPEGFGTRFGLECSYVSQPRREPRWDRLLQRLVEQGLCTPEQREALLAWPGTETSRSAGGLWPLDSNQRPVAGICARMLSHLKLVFVPNQQVSAKAYLLIKHVDRSRT